MAIGSARWIMRTSDAVLIDQPLDDFKKNLTQQATFLIPMALEDSDMVGWIDKSRDEAFKICANEELEAPDLQLGR